MQEYLNDALFLKKLDEYPHKIKYAKITVLTLDEQPIESIEGKVTGGSINIDGASSLRRTCSLSLLAYNTEITSVYWGLTNKFSLSIGLQNEINNTYPDIVWFNEGVYAITSFSSTQNNNSYNISISGKDKMSYLNGEISGQFFAKTDINHITVTSSDESGNPITEIQDLTITDIIREVVHKYGNEPFHNIIINDVEKYGLELLEYQGDTDIYCLKATHKNTLEERYSLDLKNENCFKKEDNDWILTTLSEVNVDQEITMDTTEQNPIYSFYLNSVLEAGEASGYRVTSLIYPGDLIANAGETVVSILDKICQMLGGFEYFYNVQGQFIFQQKKNYFNTAWSPLTDISTSTDIDKESYMESLINSSAYSYEFTGSNLFSSISNSPAMNSIKNDYCIWGTRKGVTGANIPIHMRYAIHNKPNSYTTINVTQEEVNAFKAAYPDQKGMKPQESVIYNANDSRDWRELIYLMAQDYINYNHLDDFEQKLETANPWAKNGKTLYEQYYEDMLAFWRLLYNPDIEDEFTETDKEIQDNLKLILYKTSGESAITDDNLENKKVEYIKLYNKHNKLLTETKQQKVHESDLKQFVDIVLDDLNNLEGKEAFANQFYLEDNEHRKYWAKNIWEAPETLIFWIDFLDAEGSPMEKYSVPAIGSRPKVVNDNMVKAINYREIENFIYYYPTDEVNLSTLSVDFTGYTPIQILPQMKNLFTTSTRGKSAKEEMDEWLYQYAMGTASATFQTIPIYYLEPNTRILVEHKDTNILDEYIINKISLPLTYNGTMSITATKALGRLY